jgi:hypothetical protein
MKAITLALLSWNLWLAPNTVVADGTEIVLESFDDPVHHWKQMNDPVMGGRSTGSFQINDGVGYFEGQVVDVPFLHAPGFIQVRTVDRHVFPDVSTCSGLQLILRAHVPYTGYRVSFGQAHAPGGKRYAYGYKATLENVPVGEFGTVNVPFTDFTDFWDDATGDPIRTCQENDLYCPDELTLRNMMTLALWGEGVAGTVSLQVQSIVAVGCSAGNE